MENDFDKIYDAIFKMNKKLSEIDLKNVELSKILSSLPVFKPAAAIPQADEIVEQEDTVADPYSVGGYRNVSLPNGGLIRIKSKPLCSSGRHIVFDIDGIIFCSHCNSIICKDHKPALDEPLCKPCISEVLKGFDVADLYVLFAVVKGVQLNKLKKVLGLSRRDLSTALSKLINKGCARQNIMFAINPTMYGISISGLASCLYDMDFILKL